MIIGDIIVYQIVDIIIPTDGIARNIVFKGEESHIADKKKMEVSPLTSWGGLEIINWMKSTNPRVPAKTWITIINQLVPYNFNIISPNRRGSKLAIPNIKPVNRENPIINKNQFNVKRNDIAIIEKYSP